MRRWSPKTERHFLVPGELRQPDEVSRIERGFPHDFYAKPMVRTFAHAGLRDRIDA